MISVGDRRGARTRYLDHVRSLWDREPDGVFAAGTVVVLIQPLPELGCLDPYRCVEAGVVGGGLPIDLGTDNVLFDQCGAAAWGLLGNELEEAGQAGGGANLGLARIRRRCERTSAGWDRGTCRAYFTTAVTVSQRAAKLTAGKNRCGGHWANKEQRMQDSPDLDLDAFYRVIAPYYDGDYADFHGGADILFYTRLAKECAGPVLEMGCGTGRMLLPLARAGMEICGMDISLPMLDRLCARLRSEPADVRERVSVIHGDIRSADAGRKFALIYAAGNVPHSFINRADQRAWLRNARRHLAPGGALVFDLFQFEYERLLVPPDEWKQCVDRIDADTGRRIQCFYRCEHELEWQRFRVELRWVTQTESGDELSESASIVQRWFTRGEIENLMELEGFQITDYWGNFSGDAFGKGSPEQVVRAVAGGS